MSRSLSIAIIILAATIGWCCGSSQSQAPRIDYTRQPVVVDCKQRWHIFYSPNMRKDTFLLDTDTGRVFEMVGDSTTGSTTGFEELPVSEMKGAKPAVKYF